MSEFVVFLTQLCILTNIGAHLNQPTKKIKMPEKA